MTRAAGRNSHMITEHLRAAMFEAAYALDRADRADGLVPVLAYLRAYSRWQEWVSRHGQWSA